MPSPNAVANAVLLVGFLSPFIATVLPNFRWWLLTLLVEAAFIAAAVWIINGAVDAETSKSPENLDVLLGYALNFWTVVIGASLFAASFAVRAWFLHQKSKRMALKSN